MKDSFVFLNTIILFQMGKESTANYTQSFTKIESMSGNKFVALNSEVFSIFANITLISQQKNSTRCTRSEFRQI